jgi:hypothetical protein
MKGRREKRKAQEGRTGKKKEGKEGGNNQINV